jgi:hypothetical protein
MDPEFMRIMNEVREMLQLVFRTENEMTNACSGTGSAGAEMLMDNLVEPGDVCLLGVNGVFGGRLAEKARRAGGIVHTMEATWGSVFDQDEIIEKVNELKPTLVAFVHAETSTGAHQPFDRLAAAGANVFPPLAHGGGRNTPSTAAPAAFQNINQVGGNFTPDRTPTPTEPATPPHLRPSSALVTTSQQDTTIKSSTDLLAFLDWQSSRRRNTDEQKKFREDALAFPRLLVFATMRKKSPFVHLVHSAGIYPNIPGADPAWKGKAVGFLGDRTRYATPQMVELGKNVAWAWDDSPICKDVVAMQAFYAMPENREKLWSPLGTPGAHDVPPNAGTAPGLCSFLRCCAKDPSRTL